MYDSLTDDVKEILTDACKVFVVNDVKVALVEGEYSNIKITTVTDLKIAQAMLERFKMINRVYQLIRPSFSQLNMKMCHFMKKILWWFDQTT